MNQFFGFVVYFCINTFDLFFFTWGPHVIQWGIVSFLIPIIKDFFSSTLCILLNNYFTQISNSFFIRKETIIKYKGTRGAYPFTTKEK